MSSQERNCTSYFNKDNLTQGFVNQLLENWNSQREHRKRSCKKKLCMLGSWRRSPENWGPDSEEGCQLASAAVSWAQRRWFRVWEKLSPLRNSWRVIAAGRLIGIGDNQKVQLFSPFSGLSVALQSPYSQRLTGTPVTKQKWGAQSFSLSIAKLSLKLRNKCFIPSTFHPFNYLTVFQVLLHICEFPYNVKYTHTCFSWFGLL